MERLWPHKGGGMRMLNLSQVQTFLAVIDEGGIQSAAERLACSQPAVSQQLRKLEEFVGVPVGWVGVGAGREAMLSKPSA